MHFEALAQVESHSVLSRRIAAAFGVNGYAFRYQYHFVHWRRLATGDVGMILHERLHKIDRFREDFGAAG